MKVKGIKAINWLLYKQYCWRYGLSEGNFQNLKNYVEGRNELKAIYYKKNHIY